jgi:hypothetical protein
MDLALLKQMLVALGCPAEKGAEMAAQLDKRARQLSQERGDSYDRSLAYLIGLMKQGWAAKERGF